MQFRYYDGSRIVIFSNNPFAGSEEGYEDSGGLYEDALRVQYVLSPGEKLVIPENANIVEACRDSIEELDASCGDMSGFNTLSGFFNSFYSLKSLDVSGGDTSGVTDMNNLFSECWALEYLNVDGGDTSKVENMSNMFAGCNLLEELNVNHFNVSNVTNMAEMFCACSSLYSLDLSNGDASQVYSFASMFAGCEKLEEINFTNFKTHEVTDMSSMFNGCKSLTSIDFSSGETENLRDLSGTFSGCNCEINIGQLDTTNVRQMYGTFEGSGYRCIDLSKNSLNHVINFGAAFAHCENLEIVDFSELRKSDEFNDNWANTAAYDMFSGDKKLKKIFVKRDDNGTYCYQGARMFDDCGSLPNYQGGQSTTSATAYVGDGGMLTYGQYNGEGPYDAYVREEDGGVKYDAYYNEGL